MTDAPPKMEYRYLGRTGLKVSVFSLGGWITYGGQVSEGKLVHVITGPLMADCTA
jgi:aryl-alcohol dehydrogenase-like predicted oxidoreductase